MKFVEPFFLLLIPVAAFAAALLFIHAAGRKKTLMRQILGDRASDPGAVHLAAKWRKWKHILISTAMLLLLLAASRPYVNTVSRDVESSGSDILILFDVSKSMRATDLPPSRMEQAKYLMREVVKAFPQDRFGVIPFAGSAFLSCPLTSDHTALAEAAEDLSTDSVPLGGTNIESALKCADRAFAGADSDHRAVLLFTDGDELSGNVAAAAENFRKRRIPVAIAGFGDPAVAAPVPDGKGGVMRSSDGKAAGSRLNEASLQRLAADTGGVYVRSTAEDTGSGVIIGFLRRLAEKRYSGQTHREVDDLFPWFILAAVAVLTAAALLPERFRNKTVLLLLLLASGVTLCGAEEKLLALPDDPYELYAQGRKQQLAGDKSAAQYYEKAVQLPGSTENIRSSSLHNLGVMNHHDGREMLNKARVMLDSQQLDEAGKSVDAAEKIFHGADELYTRAMDSAGVPDPSNDSAGSNFRQLLLDRKQAQELKKAIEKLKQQQQQARQQTQQAEQQNQKQQQQQQQNSDGKQQSGKQPQQQNQQTEPQNQQPQQQTRQAEQAAKELAEQARQLKQDKMEESAREAQKKLSEARKLQEQGKFDEAQKKLADAAEKLGREEQPAPQSGKEERSGKDKRSGDASEKEDNKSDNTPQERSGDAEKEKKSEKERANERKLELLDDESKALREAVRRRNMRRAPVEKDW